MAHIRDAILSPKAEADLKAAFKVHAAEVARLEKAIQAAHARYGDVIRRTYTGATGEKMAMVRVLDISLSHLDRIIRRAVYARTEDIS